MRLLKAAFILLASSSISVNAQSSPAARFNSYCGLLKNKIYCYGGFRGTRDKNDIDSAMFVLDISKANGASMTELQNSWNIETPNTAGVNTEKRRDCQYAAVGTKLVISGGVGGINSGPAMTQQTIAYDAEDNSWKTYPNYAEGTFGNRQIYFGSTTMVPSKGLAFYGGFERPYNNAWNISTNQNLTATVSGNFRTVGYTNVTYLDITNTNYPWVTPSQTNAPTVFSAFQASVYHPASAKIFYFGGTYEGTLLPGYAPADYKTWHQFSYALTFDTFSGAWANQTLSGVIPSERRYHSTTLLPNGQSTVLLYGGERRDTASSDFSFTLDLKTFTWTQLNINAPGVDLRRARHSAILANNETLFIVLGIDGVSAATSLPIALNIANPSAITYLEKYTDPNAPPISNPNTAENNDGLSSGAIAGIAVGAAAAGIIAFAAIFFFLRKRKAEQRNKEQGLGQHNTTINRSQEAIEVNWDEIDKQYVEMPTGSSKLTEAYSAPSYANAAPPSPMRYGDDSTTVIGNTGRYNTSPITHNSAVSHPPHSFDEVRQPYISKPDGANFS